MNNSLHENQETLAKICQVFNLLYITMISRREIFTKMNLGRCVIFSPSHRSLFKGFSIDTFIVV